MLWLYRFLSGYLRVLFYGELKERIINLAEKNKIAIWNLTLTESGIEAFIGIKGFKALPKILKASGIRVHILRKIGLPFKAEKNKRRLGWVLGPALFLIILKILSGHIWMIDVVGNEHIKAEQITAVCRELGIREGIKTKSLNTAIQRQQLLLKCEGLAWASLNIEGCRLTVNVSEAESRAEDSECICNLKAAADGIIQKIDVSSGNCLVSRGDTVKKGDILVSGILERADGTAFVHSAGAITAVTERTVTVTADYLQAVEYETGKQAVKRVLELFSLRLPLYLGTESKSHSYTASIKNMTLLGQKLPIRLYEKRICYTEESTVRLDREKLNEQLSKRVKKRLESDGISSFTVIEKRFFDTEGGLGLRETVSTEENIAVREKFSVLSDMEEGYS